MSLSLFWRLLFGVEDFVVTTQGLFCFIIFLVLLWFNGTNGYSYILSSCDIWKFEHLGKIREFYFEMQRIVNSIDCCKVVILTFLWLIINKYIYFLQVQYIFSTLNVTHSTYFENEGCDIFTDFELLFLYYFQMGLMVHDFQSNLHSLLGDSPPDDRLIIFLMFGISMQNYARGLHKKYLILNCYFYF